MLSSHTYLVTATATVFQLGRGSGQMVRVLAFYSDDPSSSQQFLFCEMLFEMNENKL